MYKFILHFYPKKLQIKKWKEMCVKQSAQFISKQYNCHNTCIQVSIPTARKL